MVTKEGHASAAKIYSVRSVLEVNPAGHPAFSIWGDRKPKFATL